MINRRRVSQIREEIRGHAPEYGGKKTEYTNCGRKKNQGERIEGKMKLQIYIYIYIYFRSNQLARVVGFAQNEQELVSYHSI
jgi:hypothetical protein